MANKLQSVGDFFMVRGGLLKAHAHFFTPQPSAAFPSLVCLQTSHSQIRDCRPAVVGADARRPL